MIKGIQCEHTILLVDDDAISRTFVRKNLILEGFKVITASHGIDALETLHNELPNLIVSGISMPQMNGYEFLRELQSDEKLKLIPFIFLSAMSTIEEVKKGYLNGADDYITKPFDMQLFITKLKCLIRKRDEIETFLKNQNKGRNHTLSFLY